MEYYGRFTDEYLSHHGIKGQRWGRRRYQNPDGSLTPEGKLRYGKTTMDRIVTRLSKLNNGKFYKPLDVKERIYEKYTPNLYNFHKSVVRKFYPYASEETIRILAILSYGDDD